jgi:hypothetical protein
MMAKGERKKKDKIKKTYNGWQNTTETKKIMDGASWTPLKNRGKLGYSRRVSCSCSVEGGVKHYNPNSLPHDTLYCGNVCIDTIDGYH